MVWSLEIAVNRVVTESKEPPVAGVAFFANLCAAALLAACFAGAVDAIVAQIAHDGRPYSLVLLIQSVAVYGLGAVGVALGIGLAAILPRGSRLRRRFVRASPLDLGFLAGGAWAAFVLLFYVAARDVPPGRLEIGSPLVLAMGAGVALGSVLIGWGCHALSRRWRQAAAQRGMRPVLAPIGVTAATVLLASGLSMRDAYEATTVSAANDGEAAFRNVILLSMDTTRRDRMSVYGHERPTTPNLERLARDGAIFTRASSHATYTLSSHASMLTGQVPSVHGATMRTNHLDQAVPSLAEMMQSEGLETGAFVANYVLSGDTGISRGFDHYDDIVDAELCDTAVWHVFRHLECGLGRFIPSLRTGGRPHWMEDHQRSATEQNHRVLDWIDRNRNKPFFLFLNYYDPHWPYLPSDEFHDRFRVPYDGPIRFFRTPAVLQRRRTPLTRADQEHLLSLYDAEIAYLDAEIGRVTDHLENLGILDETLLIITSDHGEYFGEHGYYGHKDVYEAAIGVPLMMHLPGVIPAGTVVETPVQLVDIVPTVLDLAGMPQPPGARGLSLFGAMRSGLVADLETRPVVAEDMDHGGIRRMARIGDLKLIVTSEGDGDDELYDLAADPDELHNLIGADGNLVESASHIDQSVVELLLHAIHSLEDADPGTGAEIDERTRAALRELGYIQ